MNISNILSLLCGDDFVSSPRFKRWKKDKSPRKNGKPSFQVVNEPNKDMMVVHHKLMEVIEDRLGSIRDYMPSAVACIKGVHANEYFEKFHKKRFILKMDLSHAYASVNIIHLAELFHKIFPDWGTIKDVVVFMKGYCCDEKVGLFYGAPASSMLFNLYCEELIDRKIRETPDVLNGFCGYVRYVDDLIFYSDDKDALLRTKELVREIITHSGFLENHWKTKLVDRKQGSIVVLGRQLGCLATVIKMGNNTFSAKVKYSRMRHSLDKVYCGLPSKVVGMPSRFPAHKSLECLEKDVYRLSCGVKVENPYVLVGRMRWFIQTIYPVDRSLNRTERKIIEHFEKWAVQNGIDVSFLKKIKKRK